MPPPPPPREEPERVFNVRIVEAKDVIADDDSANLFCRIMLTNPRDKKFLPKTTGILKRTNRPVWNQDFSFLFRGVSSLIVGVYGYHRLSKAVLLGRFTVEVHQIISKVNAGEVVGTWFELFDRAFEKKTGSTIFLRHYVQDLAGNTGLQALGGFENDVFVSTRARLLNFRPTELDPPESLSVFCATFNLGSEPLPIDLKPWIPEDDFDVFAIGAQEAVFAVGKDMMGKPKFNTCGAEWRARLSQHFGNRYAMITATSTRGGIRLVVFVRAKFAHLISVVDSASVVTTFNKGGAAISFFFKHTSFAFVNCHLSAHQNKTSARNAEVRHLMRSLKLKTTAPPQLDTLRQFHHVFWMGDLNYRLNFGDQGDSLSPSEAQFTSMVQKIQAGSYDELFACDQLQTEMHEGRVFAEFQETRPTFAPTFKVERCVPVVYTKQRSPAWCDRILWWSAPHIHASQRFFESASKVSTSDHKPVMAAFDADVWSLPPSYDDDLGPCSMFVRSLECHDLRKEDGGEDLEEPAFENINDAPATSDEKGTSYHHRRNSSDEIYRSTLGLPGSAQNTDLDVYDEELPTTRGGYTMLQAPASPSHAQTTLSSSTSLSSYSSLSPTPPSPSVHVFTSSQSTNNNSHSSSSSAAALSFPPSVMSPFTSPTLLPTSSSFNGPITSWRLSPTKDEPPKEKAKKTSKTPKKLFRMLRNNSKDIEKELLKEPVKPPPPPPLPLDSVRDNSNSMSSRHGDKKNSLELKESPKPRLTRVGSVRTASTDVFNLPARNMRSGSLSSLVTDTTKGNLNPYVKFRSHFLLKSFSTPLRKKTQGMLWDASDFVDPLPLTVNNPHRLLREYLSVKVCHNPGGTNKFKMKKKVPIGSALIPITISREFLQQQRASSEGLSHVFSFEVNLVKSGIIKGRLTGVLELRWGFPGDKKQPGQATSKRPAPTGKEKKFLTRQSLKVNRPDFSRPNSDVEETTYGEEFSTSNTETVLEVVGTSGAWQAVRDLQGRVCFYNAKTHVTTWDQPHDFHGVVVLEPEVLTSISGWQVSRDRLSGRLYYTKAEVSTWEMPIELCNAPELAALLAEKLPHKKSHRQQSIEPLPAPPIRRCSACAAEIKPSVQDCPICGHQTDEPLQISTELLQPHTRVPSNNTPTLRPSLKLKPFLPSTSSPSNYPLPSPPTPTAAGRLPPTHACETRSQPTEQELLQKRKVRVLADAYLQIQMPDVLSSTEFDDEGLSESD